MPKIPKLSHRFDTDSSGNLDAIASLKTRHARARALADSITALNMAGTLKENINELAWMIVLEMKDCDAIISAMDEEKDKPGYDFTEVSKDFR